MFSRAVWSPRSAAVPCGAGCAKLPFGLGITVVWVFPRDPDFAGKAGRILDLYARQWQGSLLKEDEFVISADEKTGIQARRRKHATQNCRPRIPMHVEHEYFRCGAWTYIAALDVHHAKNLRPLRIEEWHRTLGPTGGTGDDNERKH